MARSSRLLSHSSTRWKATQWKPRPLPPLENAPPSPKREEETGDPVASEPPLALGKPDLARKVKGGARGAAVAGSGSYEALQLWLVLVTLGVSLAIAVGVALVYSLGVAANYLLGAVVGVVYLRMLGRGVAELGKSRNRLGVTRLALFVGLIILATQVKSLQILPIFLGFMTYKVTLLIHLVQTLTRSSSSV